MKLLIDTNVFIPLEPASTSDLEHLSPEAARLLQVIQKERHEVFLHPKSRVDVTRDKDESRRHLRMLAFNKYPHLANVEPFPLFSEKLPQALPDSNDDVDNHLLFAVFNNAVDLLVSEDHGIHKKAQALGIENRVARIADTIRMIERLAAPIIRLPAIELKKAYALNRADPIFASLRADYPKFDEWFINSCQKKHRDGFVIEEGRLLSALCLLKHEDPPEHGLTGKVLKACTFKVAEHARGLRYGELMLKALLHYAYAESFDCVYATAFPENEAVCEFFENNGFLAIPEARTPHGEFVFAKTINPDSTAVALLPLDYHLRFGPKYIHPAAKPYIVPIQPEYHRMLFPELNQQLGLFDAAQPFGNSISKAYLCHAQTKQLASGDLLFFYRSTKNQSVQALGVVEGWIRSDDPSRIAAYVGKRTVYSQRDIETMCTKPVLAVLFRQANSFLQPIIKRELEGAGVFRHPPQSICSLGKESSEWLLNHSRM